MALERATEIENSKTHSSWGGTNSAPLSLLPVKTIRGNYLPYRPNNMSLIPLIHHQLLFSSPSLGPNEILLNTNKFTTMWRGQQW